MLNRFRTMINLPTEEKKIRPLTQPDGIVVTFAVLQLGSNLDVIVAGHGILEGKCLQPSLQRVLKLPGQQNYQVNRQQARNHRVQLPRFDLFLWK